MSKRAQALAEKCAAHVLTHSPSLTKGYGGMDGLTAFFMPLCETKASQEKVQAKLLRASERMAKNIKKNDRVISDLNAMIAQSREHNEHVVAFAEKFADTRQPAHLENFTPQDFELRAKNMVARTMRTMSANGHNPAEDYVPPSWTEGAA